MTDSQSNPLPDDQQLPDGDDERSRDTGSRPEGVPEDEREREGNQDAAPTGTGEQQAY